MEARYGTMKAWWQELSLWGAEGRALMVEPDMGSRYVFWEKAQYVPCLELAGDLWFTTEWMETGSIEDNNCYEPIMDKACRYSKVELTEANQIRTVVTWTYSLSNPDHQIFHGNTAAREQYTIFSDGTAVRTLVGWPGTENHFGLNPTLWEVGEFILINGVGSSPADVLKGCSIENLSGERVNITWPAEIPSTSALCRLHPSTSDWKEHVGILHLKDGIPSPFVGFSTSQSMFPHSVCSSCGKDHPEIRCYGGNKTYLHWPAYDSTDFAGWIRAPENEIRGRPTHTSLFSFGYSYGGHSPPKPSAWLFLLGTTDCGDPRELVQSWLTPARVTTNHLYRGYSISQRLYAIHRRDQSPCEILLAPSKPSINPIFRIENSPPTTWIEVDGKPLDQAQCRTQMLSQDVLLVLIKGEFDQPTRIRIP